MECEAANVVGFSNILAVWRINSVFSISEHGGSAPIAAKPHACLSGVRLADMGSTNAVRKHSLSGTNYPV